MGAMRDCPLCGTKLPAEAQECTTCGEPLQPLASQTAPAAAQPQAQEVECPSCMSLVPAGVDACPICGERLAPPGKATAPSGGAIPEPVPAETKECPECGVVADAMAIDCQVCGFKFEYEELSIPLANPSEAAPVARKVETSEEMPLQTRVASVEPQTYQAAQAPPAARPIARETPSEAAQKVTCPACKERIDGGVESCPLCGAIVSEYIVKCPGCGVDVPAVDEVCPECFTSLAEGAGQEAAETLAPSQDSIQVSGDAVEAAAETEAGRMCLVCGALLDDGAGSCPICKLPFGTELPPEIEVEREWDGIGIEVPKDYYLCPNCEAVLSDTEPTDCEVAERKWFYRAIIFLFSGLFLTSASIWVRGVTVESKSLGYSPMPIDYLINIGGWALVAVGFIFWLFSWRAAGSAKLCPSCGCDVRKDAETCPECGECFEMLEAGARAQQAQGLNGQD